MSHVRASVGDALDAARRERPGGALGHDPAPRGLHRGQGGAVGRQRGRDPGDAARTADPGAGSRGPEFENMIRPVLRETVDMLRRAIQLAGVTPDQLSAVVLAGGSSRIPLVAEMVSGALGRAGVGRRAPEGHGRARRGPPRGRARRAGRSRNRGPVRAVDRRRRAATTDHAHRSGDVDAATATTARRAGRSDSAAPQSTTASTTRAAPSRPAAATQRLESLGPPSRSRRGELTAAAAILLVAIGIGAFLLLRGGGDDGDASSPDTTIGQGNPVVVDSHRADRHASA